MVGGGDEDGQAIVAITRRGDTSAVLASQAQPQKGFYAFDGAFGEDSTTKDIYNKVFSKRR